MVSNICEKEFRKKVETRNFSRRSSEREICEKSGFSNDVTNGELLKLAPHEERILEEVVQFSEESSSDIDSDKRRAPQILNSVSVVPL